MSKSEMFMVLVAILIQYTAYERARKMTLSKPLAAIMMVVACIMSLLVVSSIEYGTLGLVALLLLLLIKEVIK